LRDRPPDRDAGGTAGGPPGSVADRGRGRPPDLRRACSSPKGVTSSPSAPTCRDLLSSSAERVRAGLVTVALEEAPSEHRIATTTRNRQPVVACSATSRPSPWNRARNFRTPARSAGCDPCTRDLAGDRVDPLHRDLRAMLIHAHHQRHATTSSSRRDPHAEPPGAQGIAYRQTRSVPPVRLAGRVAATTRAFLCRSTWRAGHLHRRGHANQHT
jgi:hypothetical protein